MASGEKLIAENRKARHEYHLLDRVEAGLVADRVGGEVRSARAAPRSTRHADVATRRLWLVGTHIAPYEQAATENHHPDRDRKLLLHRREIGEGKVRERGFARSHSPLLQGRRESEIALARGKDVRDRRREISKRESDQIERALKQPFPLTGQTGAVGVPLKSLGNATSMLRQRGNCMQRPRFAPAAVLAATTALFVGAWAAPQGPSLR